MELRAINSVTDDWKVRSRAPSTAGVLEALEAAEPDLAAVNACSLRDLFFVMRAGRPGSGVERWEVAQALVRQLLIDEVVGLGLLATLMPGLIAVARDLDWGDGGPWADDEEFADELVATAWMVLYDMALDVPAYPLRRVLSRTRDRLREQRRTHHRRAKLTGPAALSFARRPRPGEIELEDEQPVSVLEELARQLRDASDVAVDYRQIVFSRRVLGYSLVEIAAQRGEKVAAIKYRCRRAEALLCAG